MNKASFSILLTFLLISTSAISFSYDDEPTKKELKEISSRGKSLAEYDAVIWQASDALSKAKPDKTKIKQYIAKKVNKLWHVAFGELKNNEFYIYAKAIQDKKNVDKFHVKIKEEVDNKDFINEVHAFETAYNTFAKVNKIDRPFNILIIPAQNNEILVYIVPAALKKDVYPLGGDYRYLISADGKTLKEEKQLHRGILEVSGKGKKFTRSFTILGNQPVDTDVYHVIIRKPRIPHFIMALNKEWVYKIDESGNIKFLGKDKKSFGLK